MDSARTERGLPAARLLTGDTAEAVATEFLANSYGTILEFDANGSFARNPDVFGNFATTTKPTKGTANQF